MRITQIQKRWGGTLALGDSAEAKKTMILGCSDDNRKVGMGSAFFAIASTAPGRCSDTGVLKQRPDMRAKYAADAAANGAQLIIASPSFDVHAMNIDAYALSKLFVVHVPEPARVFAEMSAAMNPVQTMRSTAVTGTNGKSSVVAITRDVLRASGLKAFSLGTLGLVGKVPHTRLQSTLTTPSVSELNDILRTLSSTEGASDLVMEASSQGLHQHRLSGLHFDVAAFTNFTPEHLDYHCYDSSSGTVDTEGAMDRYFDAKMMLFEERVARNGQVVLFRDMERFEEVRERLANKRPDITCLTYGMGGDADIVVETLASSLNTQRLRLIYQEDCAEVMLPLFGEFQALNAACAVAIALRLEVKFSVAVAALAHVRSIPGRLEFVGSKRNGGKVFVDYAHSEDAIANVISAVRAVAKDSPLSVVFGAGGDRDQTKRGPMGARIASADRVILTNDNPRKENPASIYKAILSGCLAQGQTNVEVIPDREHAIGQAVQELPANGTLLILGKGHEDYQEIAQGETTRRQAFCDATMARRALQDICVEA